MKHKYLESLVERYGHLVYARYNVPDNIEHVYIGRGSVYGNPFKTQNNKTQRDRINNCMKFRYHCHEKIYNDPEYRKAVKELYGKVLVCYCSNGASSTDEGAKYCHGHILAAAAQWLHEQDSEEK